MLLIREYTHGFYVSGFTTQYEVNVIGNLASRYKRMVRYMEGRKVKWKVDKYYTLTNLNYTKDMKQYFFTFIKSRFDEVLSKLAITGIPYQIEHIPYYDLSKDSKSADLVFKVTGKTPYEEQMLYINYATEDGCRKLIPAQTGFGKGTVLSFSLSKLEGRSFFQIKAGYLKKLKKELLEDTSLKGDDIVILKSSKEIYHLIDKALAKKRLPHIIMCPMGMLDNYIENWKTGAKGNWDFDSPYNPVNLFNILKVKTRVIDETHEWFDKIYFIDMVTNVEKAIYLSGTFSADKDRDTLRHDLQTQLIPMNERPIVLPPVPFGEFIKIPYTLPYCHKIIHSAENSAYGYSHIKYEQQIIDKPNFREYIFNMLANIFYHFFILKCDPEDGDRPRVLYLFALKETCTLFTEYLLKRYPDLDIRRYIGEDDEEILSIGKVVNSTVKSAGTAIDMKGLILCVNTFMTKKKELSIQIRGRVRNPQRAGMKSIGRYILIYNNDSKWHREAAAVNTSNISNTVLEVITNDVVNLGNRHDERKE